MAQKTRLGLMALAMKLYASFTGKVPAILADAVEIDFARNRIFIDFASDRIFTDLARDRTFIDIAIGSDT